MVPNPLLNVLPAGLTSPILIQAALIWAPKLFVLLASALALNMSRVPSGESVPIPTLPADVMRSFSQPPY